MSTANIDDAFADVLNEAMKAKPVGEHTLVLTFNNSYEEGEVQCSVDGCEHCDTLIDTWKNIGWEGVLTKKEILIAKIPVELTFDGDDAWLEIKNPEQFSADDSKS